MGWSHPSLPAMQTGRSRPAALRREMKDLARSPQAMARPLGIQRRMHHGVRPHQTELPVARRDHHTLGGRISSPAAFLLIAWCAAKLFLQKNAMSRFLGSAISLLEIASHVIPGCYRRRCPARVLSVREQPTDQHQGISGVAAGPLEPHSAPDERHQQTRRHVPCGWLLRLWHPSRQEQVRSATAQQSRKEPRRRITFDIQCDRLALCLSL